MIAQAAESARASLGRALRNPNRVTYEMVKAWEETAVTRKDLQARWLANPSIASVTAEIIMSQSHQQPLPQLLRKSIF